MPLVVFLLGCAVLSLLSQLVVAIWENIWTVLLVCVVVAITAAVVAAILRSSETNKAGELLRRVHDEVQGVVADRDQWRNRALAAEQYLSTVEAQVNEAAQAAEERIAAAERRTQAAEKRAAANKSSNPIQVERVKHLLMLCHPDKHGNSALANDVTRWLLTLKSRFGA
jgi:hypothetical protein